jgi:hypothetical protein
MGQRAFGVTNKLGPSIWVILFLSQEFAAQTAKPSVMSTRRLCAKRRGIRTYRAHVNHSTISRLAYIEGASAASLENSSGV